MLLIGRFLKNVGNSPKTDRRAPLKEVSARVTPLIGPLGRFSHVILTK